MLNFDNTDYKCKSFQQRSSMFKTHHDLSGIISATAAVPLPGRDILRRPFHLPHDHRQG